MPFTVKYFLYSKVLAKKSFHLSLKAKTLKTQTKKHTQKKKKENKSLTYVFFRSQIFPIHCLIKSSAPSKY